MLNRWWSDSATCGAGYLTVVRRRRCRTMLCHFEAHIPVPPLRRLRPCGLASGYAWFAISDDPSLRPFGCIAIRTKGLTQKPQNEEV